MRKPDIDPDQTVVGSRVRLITAGDSTTTLKHGALGTVTDVRLHDGHVVSASVDWDARVKLDLRAADHLWEVLPEGVPSARDPAEAIHESFLDLRDAGASPFEIALASIRHLESAGLIGHHGPLTLRQAFLLEQQLRELLRKYGYIGRNESPLVRLAEEAVASTYVGMVEEDPANPGWDVISNPFDSGPNNEPTRIQVKAATVPRRNPVNASWSVNGGEFDLLLALAITPYSGEVLYAYELGREPIEEVLPKSRTLSFKMASKHGRNVTEAVQRGLELSNSPDHVARWLESRDRDR